MRSPLRPSLGAERGPSVPVIFCFMWLLSHGGWLGGGGGGDEVPSFGLSRCRDGPLCSYDFVNQLLSVWFYFFWAQVVESSGATIGACRADLLPAMEV